MFKHEQLRSVVHRRCTKKQKQRKWRRRTRHKQRRENFVLVWQHGCSANRVADMMMLTWWVTPSSVSFGCYPSYCQFGVEYQIDSREKNKTKERSRIYYSLSWEAAVKCEALTGVEALDRTPLVLYAGTAWGPTRHLTNNMGIITFTPPVRLCKQTQSCVAINYERDMGITIYMAVEITRTKEQQLSAYAERNTDATLR